MEIPVENVTPGTVAVLVNPDGSEEIVKTSVTSESGITLTLDGGASVKVVDNAKAFNDVNGSEWFTNNVACLRISLPRQFPPPPWRQSSPPSTTRRRTLTS